MGEETPNRGGHNRFDGAIGRFVAGVADFFVDAARTWGVVVFRPWTAGDRLIDDELTRGGRYLSASAQLTIAALVASFIGTAGGGDLRQVIEDVLEAAATLAGDANIDLVWKIFMAIAAGSVVFCFSRLGAWLTPAGERARAEDVFLWTQGASVISLLPTLVVFGVWEQVDTAGAFFALLILWMVLGGPGIALARWWSRPGFGLRPLRFLAGLAFPSACMVCLVFLIFEIDALRASATGEERVDVWIEYTDAAQPQEGDLVVPVSLFHDGESPWSVCGLSMCDQADHSLPCAQVTLEGEHSSWLPPRTVVSLDMVIVGGNDYVPPFPVICCDADHKRCFRGEWGFDRAPSPQTAHEP